jgi:hypothetical protein
LNLERVILLKSEAKRWVLDKRFEKFLSIHFSEKVDTVCSCGDKLALYTDSNAHLLWLPLKCRVRDLCPSCANAYRKMLTDDAVSEIGKVYNKLWIPLGFASGEFTFPSDCQDSITEKDFNAISRMALRVIEQTFSDGGRYQLAGEISIHHWSSSNPFRGQFVHVHFTVLNLSLLKAEGRFVKNVLVSYLSPARLKGMRECWTKWLNETFGTDYKDTDIHYHYSKGLGRLRHRLSYSFRLPIYDVYRVVTQAVTPIEVDSAWVKRMLVRNGSKAKRVRWFGWLQESRRREAFALLDVEYQTKAQRDKERKKVICPTCHLEMRILSTVERWEDVTDGVPCVLGWRNTGGGLRG